MQADFTSSQDLLKEFGVPTIIKKSISMPIPVFPYIFVKFDFLIQFNMPLNLFTSLRSEAKGIAAVLHLESDGGMVHVDLASNTVDITQPSFSKSRIVLQSSRVEPLSGEINGGMTLSAEVNLEVGIGIPPFIFATTRAHAQWSTGAGFDAGLLLGTACNKSRSPVLHPRFADDSYALTAYP